MSDWDKRIDWDKLTKSINGYYSTTLTPHEIRQIFKSAIDPIERRVAALKEDLEPAIKRHRDAFGRTRKNDDHIFFDR